MKVENLVLEIGQVTRDFESYFGELTSHQMNFKPSSDSWSIAQNIDHLMAVNRSYYDTIDGMLDGSFTPPFHGRIGFVVNFLGKSILRSVEPSRKRKIKTFPVWEPTLSDFGPAILDDFKREQDMLIEHLRKSEGLLKQGAVISSPANRNIVYTLETAFKIIITHEKRHLAQALEMLRAQGL
ncbi:MAG: DinB family protein [Bacteroidia bacterium]|nr:DinB family protein [Bacteroidia bacterium]